MNVLIAMALSFRLFETGSPSAITWFVIAVIIWVAVKGCSFRPHTHILKEVFELSPPVANGYAAPTIIFPFFKIRIAASGKHREPRIIFSALRLLAWRVTMFQKSFSCRFIMPTPAALGRSSSEVRPDYDSKFPAIAGTEPIGSSLFVTSYGPVRNEASEALGGHI